MDHIRALRSIISGLPCDWNRPSGRPRQTWLRTIEQALRPLNFSLVSACQQAQDRERWRRTVETATLQAAGHALDDDDDPQSSDMRQVRSMMFSAPSTSARFDKL